MMLYNDSVAIDMPRYLRMEGFCEIGVVCALGLFQGAEVEFDYEDRIAIVDLRNSWAGSPEQDGNRSWFAERAIAHPSFYEWHRSLQSAYHAD